MLAIPPTAAPAPVADPDRMELVPGSGYKSDVTFSDNLLTIDDPRDPSAGPHQGPVDAADDAGPDVAQGLVQTPEHLSSDKIFF